jgi:hypothetical protein
VAIGQNAGGGVALQGDDAVAIGHAAGENSQGTQAIAHGLYAGQVTQGINAVAIGAFAGNTSQGNSAVALGREAGNTSQGLSAVAIGVNAGANSQGISAVAIGELAGSNSQGVAATAVGVSAGQQSQGQYATALGYGAGAGTQGQYAVAIGSQAGYISQGNNSIIINATGSALDQTTANTFTVAPVRNDVANTAQVMFYNTTSKEVTYGNVISVAGNISGGNIITTGNVSGNTAGFAIGYRDIPQVSLAANVTTALTDAGKHYYSTSASNLALTIANNTSVSWSVGTAISIVNRGTANITIAGGTGVSLYLAGNSSAGNRVVTTYGMATLLNVAANVWMINGSGVS